MIRLRFMNALCWLLRHPNERVEYAGGSAQTRCPCGYINIYDRPFPLPAPRAERAGYQRARREIAAALHAQKSNYPEDVFPASSDSRDAIGGTAMRHAYGVAALIAETQEPT